jgi:predicted GIY-YIG superfamily endonuclease
LLDFLDKRLYNNSMLRKKRSDRNHIVYMLTNCVTGDYYIGVTQGSRQRDLKIRVQKHVRRALTEGKSWTLCDAIRSYGAESFVAQELAVVRGKVPAHALERCLIAEHTPALNSH